jgi:hypothetical protein
MPAPGGGVVVDDTGGIVVNGEGVAPAKPMPAITCAFPDADGSCGDVSGTGASQALSFGFPRDTFWPKSASAFLVLGIVLTLLAAQLVSPTRRLRVPRPKFRRPQPPKSIEPDTPAAVENAS